MLIPKKSRRLIGLKRTLLVVCLLALVFYSAERIIRANPQLVPVKAQIRLFTRPAAMVPDPDLGFLEPPNLHVWVANQDFECLQESDSFGFHNRMPWPETVDILFLGDSLIEGQGVGIDGQFSSLVAEGLPGKKVLNLGIGGAAPNRQLRAYRKFGASHRPDLVISCVGLAWDLEGELQFDSWLKEETTRDYDQFRIALGDRRRHKSFWTRVQRRSYLSGKLTELILRWWGIPDRVEFPGRPEIFLDIDGLRFAARPLDPKDQRVLSMVQSLKGIQTLARTQGAKFAVVLIPSKEEIYGAPSMPEVMNPAQTLEKSFREEGFAVLSLYQTIRDRGKDRPAFFTRDIHLNSYGNQITSDGIVNWLKESGLLTGTSAVKLNKPRLDIRKNSS